MAKEMTVRDIAAAIESFAPPELAEPWDNAGLQAGEPRRVVTGVLTALDVTHQVVEEALSLGCNMIAAHHPIFFRGVKSLAETAAEGRLAAQLIRNEMALYTAHTALDKAKGGINDALAARLGLEEIAGEGFVRSGLWRGGDCGALLAHVKAALDAPGALLYGDPATPARRVALCSGDGMKYWREEPEADVFLTGDVAHHDALDALAEDICVIDAGHRGTERVAAELLAAGLQKAMDVVQYPLRIFVSKVDVYQAGTGKP